jgi:prepilin-type N-terminal cleavage/methylation domain-containing protein
MKLPANFGSARSNSGFSLVELAIAMAIMALVAAATVPNFLEDYNDRRATVAIQETQTILDAARAYRVDNGTWPGGAACVTAWNVLTAGGSPYMAGITTNNKYNFPYTLSCVGNTFRVEQRIVPDWDSVVANGLPGTTIVNATNNTIRSVIGVPGSEPSLDSKLSRINTGNPEHNRMRTTMLMGGNAINEGGDINLSKANPVITAQSGSLNFNSASGMTYMNGTLVVDDVMLGVAGRRVRDAIPNYVHKGTFVVGHGWLVAKPSCPNGGTPKALLRPGNINAGYSSGGSVGVVAVEYRAIDSGTFWTVSTNTYGNATDRNNMDSLIDTYCYYP